MVQGGTVGFHGSGFQMWGLKDGFMAIYQHQPKIIRTMYNQVKGQVWILVLGPNWDLDCIKYFKKPDNSDSVQHITNENE